MPVVFSTQLVFPPGATQTLAITTSNPLATAKSNMAYSQGVQAVGGTPPYTWSIINWSQYTVAVVPTSITFHGVGATETTSSVTASGTGGATPYSFSWVITGSSAITATNPTQATTAFTGTGLTPNQTVSGTATCTITDSLGRSQNVTVPVSIQRLLLNASMVAGSTGSTKGYSSGLFGTLTPSTDLNGNVVASVQDTGANSTFSVTIQNASLSSTYLSSCTITGGAINTTLLATAANFINGGGGNWIWQWPGLLGLVSGTTYAVVIA